MRKPPHDVPRTFIVANRLPVEHHPLKGWQASPGGLVSALKPALNETPAVWVGWRGCPSAEDPQAPLPTLPPQSANVTLMEIPMNGHEVKDFYDGVCNGMFWPLYHEASIAPTFSDDALEVYGRINQRFADCVATQAPLNAIIWVHDYHLQLVPQMLRKLRPDLRIGFFLHVPFPAAEEFQTLPWKESVLHGLLGADLIGFQTQTSAQRFIDAACQHLNARTDGQHLLLTDAAGRRPIKVGVFPVGPDAQKFASLAATRPLQAAAAKIRTDVQSPELVLLGIDRLDYTKGIDLRIRAVKNLLVSEAFKGRDIQFIQVAMPSRTELATYQQLRVDIDQALQRANDELVSRGLRPMVFQFEALTSQQVTALFVAADIMLVTSLADGMNLVCKEFIACKESGSGRLVLSKAAGAAAQLGDAWLVDPQDVADLERGIGDAIQCSAEDAHARMSRLRYIVFQSDAKQWAHSFLKSLDASI